MTARKALILDTSIVCVMIGIPGKTECGSDTDRWTQTRVHEKLETEKAGGTTLVLPLATIIETGNHIAQAKQGDRYTMATKLGSMMFNAASGEVPWTAFAEQQDLWNAESLMNLAEHWPRRAVEKVSLGDFTISEVAKRYRQAGFAVEIFTGDQGLKAMEPLPPSSTKLPQPRRRHRR